MSRWLTGAVRTAWSALGSRSFSFWALGAWVALTLVWVIPFQISGQPGETIRAIAEEWVVLQVVYVAVAGATLACGLQRVVRDVKRVRTRRMREEPAAHAAGPFGADVSAVSTALGARGYAVVEVSPDRLLAARNRLGLLGGSVFHFGLLIFGIAFVAHGLTIQAASVRVVEGQSFAAAVAADPESSVTPMDVSGYTLTSVEPEYYEDVLLFTRLDATLSDIDGSEIDLSLSDPYWIDLMTNLSIQDYGLAPHISVARPGEDPVESVVAMSIFPPGNEDEYTPEGVSFSVSVIAYPDHGVVDGTDVSLSYNIGDPRFLVALEAEGVASDLLARDLLALGEPIQLEGYEVSVTGLSRYGTFRILRAPFLPLVALALLATMIGIVWRTFFRRLDVRVWGTDDGLYVDAWLDRSGRPEAHRRVLADLRREGVLE